MDSVSSMLPLAGGAAGLVALFFLWKKSSAVRADWPESRRKAFERALIGAAVALSCYLLYAFREMAYGVGGVLIFALGVAIPALLFRRAGEAADRSEPGVVPEVPAAQLSRLIRKVRVPALIEWGGVPIPVSAEPQHFAVLDASGEGRRAALSAILAAIRARGDTAFVLDAEGALLSRHYDPDVDFIFNPADARSIDRAPDAENAFSAAEMVRAEHSGALFLTYRASEREALRERFAELLEDAGRAVLELEPDTARRVWFLVDDVAALERMPVLEALLTRARVNGACVVLGMASLDSMEEVYGARGARNLLEQVSGWLVMACADEPTAQYASERLDALARADALPQAHVALERLAAMPSLQGLLRLPGGYPIAQVSFAAPEVRPKGVFEARRERSTPRPALAPAFVAAVEPSELVHPSVTPPRATSPGAAEARVEPPVAAAPSSKAASSARLDEPPAAPAARGSSPAAATRVAARPDASDDSVLTRGDGPSADTAHKPARTAPAQPSFAPSKPSPQTSPAQSRRPEPAGLSEGAHARADEASAGSSAHALEALVRAAHGRASLAERLAAQGQSSDASDFHPTARLEPARPVSAAPARPVAKSNPMLDGLLRTNSAGKGAARAQPEQAVEPVTQVPSPEAVFPAESDATASMQEPASPVAGGLGPEVMQPALETTVPTSASVESTPPVPAQPPREHASREHASRRPQQDSRAQPRSSARSGGGQRPRDGSKPAGKPGEPTGGKARDMLQGLLK